MTEDNYIIFNNLIIGQTANDHAASVNTLGRTIELHFILRRLITACVCVCVCVVEGHCMIRRKKRENQEKKKQKEMQNLKCREVERQYCFLCVLSSFNTGSESVPLNPPALWCIKKSTHTRTHSHAHARSQEVSQKISVPHSFHASMTISNFPLPPFLNDTQTLETSSVTPETVPSNFG